MNFKFISIWNFQHMNPNDWKQLKHLCFQQHIQLFINYNRNSQFIHGGNLCYLCSDTNSNHNISHPKLKLLAFFNNQHLLPFLYANNNHNSFFNLFNLFNSHFYINLTLTSFFNTIYFISQQHN